MTWNEPETATIFLVNGEQVSANVNGISLEDGSGHAFVHGREIKVLPLRGPWADTWGEAITLQHRENAITLALNPTEISDRWAIVDDERSKKTLYLLFDTGGIWREMTGEELEQWRRIWMDGKHDRERIEREWHIYLHTKTQISKEERYLLLSIDPEELARFFHTTYEQLAPQYAYSTRKESSVPWEQVPENNRQLMIATAKAIITDFLGGIVARTAHEKESEQ